ncbi:uncharacterized protein PAC_10978 [Phialocephala subalpina]|uniref:HMG box domain-containing protein n=1 Tax=Phialocephala subalpina TaxID=576137 RepID=A0A1L7X7T6_9HELO|nr:uncharacterized protein PAC_10978 [Phialocephala subalpina]
MLSAIGRAAVKRVVAGGPQSTNRTFQTIWQLQRVALSQRADNDASQSHPWLQSKRSYVTASKATKTTKSKSSTTAKPRAKKGPAKKVVKKPLKRAAKKTVKRGRPALKKKPVKKPVKAKKILTEEQKKKLAVKQERALIKELKIKALTPPKQKPRTAWSIFVSKELANTAGKPTERMGTLPDKYKAISPSELESLNHIANQNKTANVVAYKQWVESHTPDQIRIANNARLALKKKLNKTSGYPAIKDSRLPKRITNARALFTKDRYASGDFKGISLSDASKLLSSDWNSLSPSERKAYTDRAAADTQRYVQEFKTVFHRDSTAQT